VLSDDRTSIHALLIGIDHYPPAPVPGKPQVGSLHGCVQDVLEVERLLRDQVGVPATQIELLISPHPGAVAPCTPLPTYVNIVRAWQNLIARASPGRRS
jgi:hypothetical protein